MHRPTGPQVALDAEEVDDMATDALLAEEFPSQKFAVLQALPKRRSAGVGLFLTMLSLNAPIRDDEAGRYFGFIVAALFAPGDL